MSEIATMSFEDAMKELESVVSRLESGECLAGGFDQALRTRRRAARPLRGPPARRPRNGSKRSRWLAQGQPTGTTKAEGL
jgi:exodeoxyribonuclease VII small subunit